MLPKAEDCERVDERRTREQHGARKQEMMGCKKRQRHAIHTVTSGTLVKNHNPLGEKKKKKQEKNKTITKEEKNGCTEDEMEVGFGCDYKTSIVIIIIFLLIVPHCSIPGVRSWSIFSSTFLYFSSSR